MDVRAQLQELIREQPYFVAKKEAVFFQWLDKLLELAPLKPDQKYKAGESGRQEVLPWMKALIKDEVPDESLVHSLEAKVFPNFFTLGHFCEWRASLALTMLKAKSAIVDFDLPIFKHVNESLGIDSLISLKSSKGEKRWLPIQVKSFDSAGQGTIHFSMTDQFFEKMKVAPQSIINYLKRNDNGGRMKRLIPSFTMRAKSITELADEIKKTINEYRQKKMILRSERDFDEMSRHEKIAELVKSGFFRNLAKVEQHQSPQSPHRQCLENHPQRHLLP